MKKTILISSILAALAFTGCDYEKKETTTTNVSDNNGNLNVVHTKENDQTVNIAGETFKSSSKIGVTSDGTVEGTKGIFDINLDTPSLQESISLAYDNAKTYTEAESKALFDKAADASKSIASAAQEQFDSGVKYLKDKVEQ